MLKLPTDIVQPGMVLAKPITDDMGRTLLRQGVALTEEYISVLKHRGAALVFVSADDTDSPYPDSTIPDEAVPQAAQTMARIFEVVRQVTAKADAPPEEAAKDPAVANALQNNRDFSQLEQTTDSILRELFDKKTLYGLSQIKSRSTPQYSHAVNVAVTALLIGINLHLNIDDLVKLGVGCLLHDIGKIFFNPEMLKIDGTVNNRLKLREHARLGYELLRSRNPDAVTVNHIALSHHERQDGLGYPRGLQGTNTIERARFGRDNILLIAEIAAVADTYDILSSGTATAPPLPPPQVASSLRRLSGTFLNRELVKIFLSMLPVLPVGMKVIIRTGRYTNYKGVVLEANTKQPERPVIRLLFNPTGTQISPIDLNLATKDNLLVEAVL